MGGASPDLTGVALEWEACTVVREHLRVKGCLFTPALRCAAPACTVKCGERNVDVLIPLAKRLRVGDNLVGQIKVPHVVKQSLVSI